VFLVEKIRGLTKIKFLKLEKNGHFKRWPKGFFEEGYKEAMGIAEAQSF
jgi:predicted ATPase